MRTKWIVIAVAIVIALFAIGAAACSDDDDDNGDAPETNGDTAAQLCSDLAELDVALNAYGDIDLDSTKAALEEAQQAVDDAFDNVSRSVANTGDVQIDVLQTAVEAMDEAVSDVPDDSTIADGLASLGEEAAAVDAAISGLLSDAGC